MTPMTTPATANPWSMRRNLRLNSLNILSLTCRATVISGRRDIGATRAVDIIGCQARGRVRLKWVIYGRRDTGTIVAGATATTMAIGAATLATTEASTTASVTSEWAIRAATGAETASITTGRSTM